MSLGLGLNMYRQQHEATYVLCMQEMHMKYGHYRNTSYTVIVTRPLGEGDFINESLVATIIYKIFPSRLPIAPIYRICCPSIRTHLFSLDY